jgi:hypothetical protein
MAAGAEGERSRIERERRRRRGSAAEEKEDDDEEEEAEQDGLLEPGNRRSVGDPQRSSWCCGRSKQSAGRSPAARKDMGGVACVRAARGWAKSAKAVCEAKAIVVPFDGRF